MPRFYETDRDGLPERWIQMIRETIAGLGPKVLASRMVRDYVTSLYAPATAATRSVETVSGGAQALATWKARVRKAWPGVAVDHVESLDGDKVEVRHQDPRRCAGPARRAHPGRHRGATDHRPDGQ